MATRKKTSTRSSAKTPAKTRGRKALRSARLDAADVTNATEKSTFTFRIEAFICKDDTVTPAPQPSVIYGESKEEDGKKTLEFRVDTDNPPTFNMATALKSFGVENEDLTNAAKGNLTLTKLDVKKSKTAQKTDFSLDVGVKFEPSDTFILNRFKEVIEIKKVELTLNKTKTETTS
ncbi:MAG: hypothetical protein AAF990_22495 [Bacteroidota bacterium]